MRRLLTRFIQLDTMPFQYINGRLQNRFLNFLLFYISHLGGRYLRDRRERADLVLRIAVLE